MLVDRSISGQLKVGTHVFDNRVPTTFVINGVSIAGSVDDVQL